MNNAEINKIVKRFGLFVGSIPESNNDNDDEQMPNWRSVAVWSRADFGTLKIWGDSLKEYQQCVELLYRAVNGKGEEHLSEREIERILQEITLETLDTNDKFPGTTFPDRLKQNLLGLKDRLTKKPLSWDVYFAVEGFDLTESCFVFGKVKFLAGEKATLRDIRHRIYRIILQGSNSPQDKRFFCKDARQDVDEHYKGKTIAHIKVNAVDQEAAQGVAQRELKLTLDVLNLQTTFVHPYGTRVRVYLPGQAVFRQQALHLLFDNSGNIGMQHELTGPMDNFRVASLNGDTAVAFGITQASRILSLDKRSVIEERIVAAMRFAGRACADETREQAFLNFAIAIESLLGDKDSQGEITYKLAMRCAHLLSSDIEKRRQIRDSLKKLYGVRSKIVHRGSLEVTDSQLGTIRTFARHALVKVLKSEDIRDLKTDDEFIQWFEEKMLA